MANREFAIFTGTATKQLDHRTAVQAIEFVYSNLLDVSRVQIIYPIVLSYVFWGTQAGWKIFLWSVASILVYVSRMLLTLQYRKRPPEEDDPWKWGRYFSITSFFSRLLWGAAAWLFYQPDAQTELVLLYVLIVGTAAGAIMISAYWMPGYLLYAVPAVTLMILSLFVNGDKNENILAVMLCLFLVMLISVAFKSREQGYASIRLRFENLDLIEKLNVEKERAEDANRAKTRFLAAANHDLRQPVHALSLLSYSMKSELSSEKGLELYSQLEQTVSNLNSLLESLLDLSQLEAGALKVVRDDIELPQIAAQLQSEFLSLCRQKNLEFRVRVMQGRVCTDHTLLLRLLRNLLSNAVRYTPDGGVLLAFRRRADSVSIEIWDTGIGIDDDNKTDVFREFFQVENSTRMPDKGLGLGLAICQKIATLLDLQLSMHSRPGRGTVFRIALPLLLNENRIEACGAGDTGTEPTDHAEGGIDDEYTQRLKGLRALVIDDDLIGLGAMSVVLSSFGMETTLAQTADRAMELLDDGAGIDMILSDYQLSEEINGIELIDKIRARPGYQHTPAVIVTGDTAPAVLARIQSTGIPCLNKPVIAEQLAQRLSECCNPV
ncbi:hypothetical protein AB833_21565 [Chromatiales bacterium (ex Bugula neritina AB1)]|nr:hypothetical protein AB833_21565 [Chromatiales bacterium (ex Bugula neritina AB1)]